ncbi:hypothetical protein ACFVT5_04430 [Streptomyces sp. NPDC058001]|uniref:hypothetical protein n=1 Tax=Streptomyces sp. NPDC058001 TaxID=3346300 RepID=UPI0036E31218
MSTGMISLRTVGVAAVLAALPAATAHARAEGSVAVNPSEAPPGSEVDLRVTGCEGTSGRAASDAFVAPADLAPSADGPTLFAQTRIKSSAAPGDYTITVTCDGKEAKAKDVVHVVAHGSGHEPAASPTAPQRAGGGTSRLTPAEESEGPGTRQAVIGLVLAGVAACVVVFRVRRRRPHNGRDE